MQTIVIDYHISGVGINRRSSSRQSHRVWHPVRVLEFHSLTETLWALHICNLIRLILESCRRRTTLNSIDDFSWKSKRERIVLCLIRDALFLKISLRQFDTGTDWNTIAPPCLLLFPLLHLYNINEDAPFSRSLARYSKTEVQDGERERELFISLLFP